MTDRKHIFRRQLCMQVMTGMLVAGTLAGCFPADSDRKPNILIITMDTTRADHLSCYGYKKTATSNLDRLAREGVLFETAYSTQPVTLPSHSSIMTGCYPFHHGVRDNGIYQLSQDATTLAEILSAEGYLTTAFPGSYILNRIFGLSQGFEYYNDQFVKPKQKGQLPVDRRASEVSFLANEWFEAVRNRIKAQPFFLWLHYYDPHADYDPPFPYRSAYEDPYDGEIAYTDDWIGFVFDSLRLLNLWDTTLTIVTADHGESLGEHGEKTHGIFVYDSTIHVPLIMRYTPGIPAGTRVADPVSSIDIVPTVLDLAGIRGSYRFDGCSLSPLIAGNPATEERTLYSEAFIPRSFHWSDLRALRKNGWLFIRAPRNELYPPGSGCTSEENHISMNSDQRAFFDNSLRELLKNESSTGRNKLDVDAEMVDKLKALGYFVGSDEQGPETADSAGLPDPKDRIDIFNRSQLATNLAAQGMSERAVSILKELVIEDPGNPRLLMDTAQAAIESGQYELAREYLDSALAIDSKNAGNQYLLGLCYENWSKPEEAIEAYRASISLNPEHFLSHFHLGLIYIKLSRWEESIESFRKCAELKPDNAEVWNNLGFIAIKGSGDHKKGIELLRKAMDLDPQNPQVQYSLGLAYMGLKDYAPAREHLMKALEAIPDNLEFIRSCKEVFLALGDEDSAGKMEARTQLLIE
jgi:choline-sulfatase